MNAKAEPKKHSLKNNFLTITINEKGAELSSLKSSEREYIWQANGKFWARHAPILFPIVGRLINHEYSYKDKTYTMSQHGFARDCNFKLIDISANHIVLELTDTEKSKQTFPFDFTLQVKYTLLDTSLFITYTVINPSLNDDLYFSIGAHPAFNCPFEAGHNRNEYQLVFDKQLEPESENIIDGLRTNKTTNVFDQNGKFTLHDTIFDNDALIFNRNPFSKVTFVHKPTQKAFLTVTFKNYPYLGIWSSDKKATFVCIEPWHGITDSKNHNKALTEKEGIIKLLPQKTFSCEYTVEVL